MAVVPAGSLAASPSQGRPFYARVAALGLLLLAVAPGLFLVAMLASGQADAVLMFAVIAALAVLLAGLVYRFGSWASIVSAVFGLAMLALLGHDAPWGLTHPQSFFDFATSLFGVVGALTTLVAAVAVVVQRRRGSARSAATRFEQRAVSALVVALVALTALSGIASIQARTTVAASAKVGAVAVTMQGFAFAQPQIEVQAGQAARVVVSNSDPALHTFTVQGTSINEAVAPGAERLVDLSSLKPGTYSFYCIPHPDMKGTLEVK